MGIQGLLPLLKSIQKPCSLKQFAGQTIGVDAYGWLHRGTVSCAVELATGKPTTKYVEFAMSRVRMLKHFGITPYLVFDGDYLPSKSKTEKERSARRKESKKLGLELLNLGRTSQAYLELQKAVDVTPEMAGLLIEELKRASVPYVVAPFEADSQMVYLEKQGLIDGILSEDSDLLVFGARRLLTKLDQYGNCIMIRRDDFTACREVSFAGWSDREFRQMAILSGCDYLNSIEKMGLKTAHRLLRKHRTVDRVIRALQFDGKFKVPTGYAEAFHQAELTFLHQWVYCPKAKSLVHFMPLEDGMSAEDLPFIGAFVDAETASGVARGELHPHSKEPLKLPDVPKRSWMSTLQQTKPAIVETPALKRHKSIDSFFKPKRTPLAELDVNLFTGSPSQQEMARRASGTSWPATPVENHTPTTSISRPSAIPSSAPAAARRTFSGITPLSTRSERAPKRQRLCADGSSPVSQRNVEKIEFGTSKFFGGPNVAGTPSTGKTNAKILESDFALWSDDSIEEALSQLPLPEGSRTKPKMRVKKLEIFSDEAAHKQSEMPRTTASQDKEMQTATKMEKETQSTTMSTVFSQSQQQKDTPSSSIDVEESERPSESLFDANLKVEISNLRARYSLGADHLSKMPLDKPQKRSSSHAHLSKLQFDGAFDIVGSKLERSAEKEVRHAQLPRGNNDQNQAEDKDVVVPGSDSIEPSSPEKPSYDNVPSALLVGGTEDLLVSESEAEASEPETPKQSVFMNLGRFAFGAV
ncbi:uncharacterized protein PV09_07622 [Verruconis gallopava]|uniref:Uncharacterized protein n=1 Tax=Verruconis gallopava TaxID=253628 RepID=A0A0D2A394_9PEZI|nr:uncharacterized protein PV09_07622 [Verruconis gallopava]KIW00865.1 hypothetical protein PV09_07622 [Verruconis gallopava]